MLSANSSDVLLSLAVYRQTGSDRDARAVADSLKRAFDAMADGHIRKDTDVTVGFGSGCVIKSGLLWAIADSKKVSLVQKGLFPALFNESQLKSSFLDESTRDRCRREMKDVRADCMVPNISHQSW